MTLCAKRTLLWPERWLQIYNSPPQCPEFKRAIELNPNYATAHQWFGECLQSQGHLEEALAELKRAQELDPLSLIINSVLGFALDTVGKSDEAIAQLHKTIEIDPNFVNAHGQLGNVLEHRGRLKEAIVEYEKCFNSVGSDPIDLANLAAAYFLAGRKQKRSSFGISSNLCPNDNMFRLIRWRSFN